MEQLIRHLTSTAKLHAEGRLAEASQMRPEAMERREELNVPVLLEAATQLIKAGGLVNYFRSAGISEKLIEGAVWAPGIRSEAPSISPPELYPGMQVGVMFVVWLLLGAAAVAVSWALQWPGEVMLLQVWAAGFVALAVRAAWRRF